MFSTFFQLKERTQLGQVTVFTHEGQENIVQYELAAYQHFLIFPQFLDIFFP